MHVCDVTKGPHTLQREETLLNLGLCFHTLKTLYTRWTRNNSSKLGLKNGKDVLRLIL